MVVTPGRAIDGSHEGYTRDDALRSVAVGWASLIHTIYDKLDEMKHIVKVIQVKEKWGALRVYTEYQNDEFEKVNVAVCKASETICEICGNPGTLRDESKWFKTRCEEHRRTIGVTND
jgi:hypothetical protein